MHEQRTVIWGSRIDKCHGHCVFTTGVLVPNLPVSITSLILVILAGRLRTKTPVLMAVPFINPFLAPHRAVSKLLPADSFSR